MLNDYCVKLMKSFHLNPNYYKGDWVINAMADLYRKKIEYEYPLEDIAKYLCGKLYIIVFHTCDFDDELFCNDFDTAYDTMKSIMSDCAAENMRNSDIYVLTPGNNKVYLKEKDRKEIGWRI